MENYGERNGEPLVWVVTMSKKLGDDADKKVLMTATEILIETGPSYIIVDETEGSKLKGEVIIPKASLTQRVKDGITRKVSRVGAVAGG